MGTHGNKLSPWDYGIAVECSIRILGTCGSISNYDIFVEISFK